LAAEEKLEISVPEARNVAGSFIQLLL